MRFKDHFLLTENPDDLYTQDSSAITFGFCSNFVFWFDPAPDSSFIPTHVELLLIAKAKHLNKPIEALVQSAEYRRKLNSFKKLYHEKGYMPLDCVNFLKGTDMLYGTTRDDFINDVPHAFLGRLSIKGNIISFWNPPNNFNEHTKQTVKDFLGYVNMNPEALMYNFELQGSREINLTYHQFFNIKKEETPKTKVDTKHIVHTTDPAKKQEVLKGMGVKPKTPIDIKTKYAMEESFKDHFLQLISEKNYSYNIPSDKELLLYDFYMVTYLNALEKEGKFEPGGKIDAYGQTTSTATHSMGIRDSTLHSFNHIKEQILNFNKENMLEESFFSICCELRHVFDNNQVDSIKNQFGKEIGKIIGHYYINYKNQTKRNNLDYDTVINRILKKREQKKKEKYGIKDVAVSNKEYTYSYNAALKTIHQTNIDKEEFVNICKQLFEKARWISSYGGSLWANICSAYIILNNSKNEFEKIFAIDNMYHQQHNTGSVFTKLQSYMKGGSHDWILKALDFKADVKDNWERVKKIKELLDRDYPGKGLRGVDRMYIEMLKASGDKTYEQYFQTKKPEEKKDAVNDPNSPAYANMDKQKFIDIAKKYITDEKYKDTCKKYRLFPVGFGDANSPLNKQLDIDSDYIYKDSGKSYKPDSNYKGIKNNSMYFISSGIWKSIFGNDAWHKIKDLLLGKTEEESNTSELSKKHKALLRKIKQEQNVENNKEVFDSKGYISIGKGTDEGLQGKYDLKYENIIVKAILFDHFSQGAMGTNDAATYYISVNTFKKLFGEDEFGKLLNNKMEANEEHEDSSSNLSPQKEKILAKAKHLSKLMFSKDIYDNERLIAIGPGTGHVPGLAQILGINKSDLFVYSPILNEYITGISGLAINQNYYLAPETFTKVFGKDELGNLGYETKETGSSDKIPDKQANNDSFQTTQLTNRQSKNLMKQIEYIFLTLPQYCKEILHQWALMPLGYGNTPNLSTIYKINPDKIYFVPQDNKPPVKGNKGMFTDKIYWIERPTLIKLIGSRNFKELQENITQKLPKKNPLPPPDLSGVTGESFKQHFLNYTKKLIN